MLQCVLGGPAVHRVVRAKQACPHKQAATAPHLQLHQGQVLCNAAQSGQPWGMSAQPNGPHCCDARTHHLQQCMFAL